MCGIHRRVGDNGTVADGADGDAAAPLPAPAAVAQLVASCIRFVATRYKTALDHTPDTLSLLDQYVRDARAELGPRPEAIELVQGAVGAYFGELVRVTYGGYWVALGDPSTWRVRLRHVYLSFNPIGVAREALLEQDAEGFGAHFRVDPGERELVEQRVASLPAVPEDEYYTPSTRWEVLQVICEVLRAHMAANGTGDVTFESEDYE